MTQTYIPGPGVPATTIMTGAVGADAVAVDANNPIWTVNDANPATHARVITPSDTDVLNPVPRAIIVAGSGDVKMIGRDAPAGATGIVFPAALFPGQIAFRPKQILATGTTANLTIIALY